MTSNAEVMKKMFPKCPICGSEEGYEFSAFYPDVRCTTCKAEWSIFKDGIELKKASEMDWDKELLNKKYPFKFWKELKRPAIKRPEEKQVEELIHAGEKVYAPVDYIGGHTDFKNSTVGYVVLKPDSITFTTKGVIINSKHKMNVQMPIEKIKGIEIRTGKEITFLRWFLIGAWSILFKKKTEYLVLTYEESSGMLQHMVFDFHNQRKMVDELITLVNYLKRKKSK